VVTAIWRVVFGKTTYLVLALGIFYNTKTRKEKKYDNSKKLDIAGDGIGI